MNNALKGALLSGLVVPGLGQLVFKQYFRAAALMLTTLGSLTIITIKIVQVSLAILTKTQTENGAVGLGEAYTIAMQASMHSFGPTFNVLMALLLACWVISVVDAYATGKKADRNT
jgi:hypothetical protein